jgi:hypothetical protein
MEIREKVHLVGFYTLAKNYRIVHGVYNIKISYTHSFVGQTYVTCLF